MLEKPELVKNNLVLNEYEKGALLGGLEHYLSIEKQNEDSDKTNLLRGVFDKYSSEKDFVLDTNEQQAIFEGLTPYLKERTKNEIFFSALLSFKVKEERKNNNNLLRNVFKKIIPNIETSMSSEEFLLMGIVVDENTNRKFENNLKRLEDLEVTREEYLSYENYFLPKEKQRADFW